MKAVGQAMDEDEAVYMENNELTEIINAHVEELVHAHESGDLANVSTILANYAVTLSVRNDSDIAHFTLTCGLCKHVGDILHTATDMSVIDAALGFVDALFKCGSEVCARYFEPFFQYINEAMENESADAVLVARCVRCVASFARGIPSNDPFFPFNVTLDVLLPIFDKYQDARVDILNLCSAVIEKWPMCIYVNQLIDVGCRMLHPDVDPTEFFKAVRLSIKNRREDAVSDLQETELIGTNFHGLVDLMTYEGPLQEAYAMASMKVIRCIMRYVHSKRLILNGLLNYDFLIRYAFDHDGEARVAAYLLLSKGIATQSRHIVTILENGLHVQLRDDVIEGNYRIRMAAVCLIYKMAKHCRGMICEFIDVAMINTMISLVDDNSPKYSLIVTKFLLGALGIYTDRIENGVVAAIIENEEVFDVFGSLIENTEDETTRVLANSLLTQIEQMRTHMFN